MSLNIMIAGCGKDERETIEKSIRDAFGGHAESDAWNVSLVNVANQWSVEMDGTEPRFKGLSFVAPAEDLAASVRRALKAAGAEEAAAAAAPSPSPPPAPERAAPVPVPVPVPPVPEPPPPAAASPPARLSRPAQPSARVERELPAAVASVARTTAPPSETSLPLLDLELEPESEPEPEPEPEPLSTVEQTLSSRPAPLSNASTPAAARAVQTPLVDGDRTERHQCEGCSAAFDVFYYAVAGERMERCPVACPSCWHVNNVPIAAGAGLNGDYRAQAAS